MSKTIWLGAVAYNPKVVTIWEGMRRYFHEEAHLPVEVVLFQSYEAQIAALLAQPGEAVPRITALLPGAEAPTILPLHGRPGHFAVHAVCQESVFWETLQKLKAADASAILVVPIEKMML